MRPFPLLLALLLASARGAAAGDEAPLRPYVEISGASSKVERPEWLRVTTEGEWVALWCRHVGADATKHEWRYNQPGVPRVDFGACMVLAIFGGRVQNSAGIACVEMADEDERLLFRFDHRSFQTGPNPVAATPYGFFVVPRTPKPVVFEENVQGLIGAPPKWKERARLDAIAEADEDVAIATRAAAALAPDAGPVAKLLEALKPSSVEEDRDIGFGARRIRVALYGDQTTTWVTIVACGDRVGPVGVHCYDGDGDTWSERRDRIAAAYAGHKVVIEDTGLRAATEELFGPEEFRKERARVLGEPLEMEPHPELERAYRLLGSPLSDLRYGLMCGDGGDPPPGRPEIEKVIAHEHAMPVLLDLLCGPNPEGRVFAAEALLRLEKKGTAIPERARKGIEWVRNARIPILVCRGCEMSEEPAKAALGEMLDESGR